MPTPPHVVFQCDGPHSNKVLDEVSLTGAPLVIDLPHGACVRICTRCQLFPISGKPFVNEGIAPDVEIMPTADDFILGHDRVLEYTFKMFDKD